MGGSRVTARRSRTSGNEPPPRLRAPAPLPWVWQARPLRRGHRRPVAIRAAVRRSPRRSRRPDRVAARLSLLDRLLLAAAARPAQGGALALGHLRELRRNVPGAAPWCPLLLGLVPPGRLPQAPGRGLIPARCHTARPGCVIPAAVGLAAGAGFLYVRL